MEQVIEEVAALIGKFAKELRGIEPEVIGEGHDFHIENLDPSLLKTDYTSTTPGWQHSHGFKNKAEFSFNGHIAVINGHNLVDQARPNHLAGKNGQKIIDAFKRAAQSSGFRFREDDHEAHKPPLGRSGEYGREPGNIKVSIYLRNEGSGGRRLMFRADATVPGSKTHEKFESAFSRGLRQRH